MPFRDVIERHPGHRRLVALLARSVDRGTLPPSLIFSGPAGSGKRQTAVATAQALNCLSPRGEGESLDACGTCAACTRIARGAHPDVFIVEPGESGPIKIEQVRDVIDRAGYRPFEGRRRVVVVDQADAMAAPPQNALLKVLEEPPPSTVMILVTARPDMLLPTVQSRCQRLRFQLAAHPEVDEDARDVARRVLERAASAGEPQVRIEAAKDLLENTGAGGREDREQLASHLHAMASLLRDIELLSSQDTARGSPDRGTARLANPDVEPSLERLKRAYAGQRGLNAYEAVDKALLALDGNASVKIVADWLVLQL
jgi:DNA polymerase-3 subunit delta'